MVDALHFHRVAHRLNRSGFARAASVVQTLGRMVCAAHIGVGAEIGEGTSVGYGGIGIIVHTRAKIGRDVLISPNVVIGGRNGLEGVPVIEDGVKIGAGAKILGPVRIGKNALIGANAVVVCDVPEGATAVGIPARIVVPREKQAKSA